MAISTVTLATALGVAFGGVAYGVTAYDPVGSFRYPASAGQAYLQQNGYRNVRGGERDYTGRCASVGRNYLADKDGVTGVETVCFSRLFWAHRPK